MLRCKIGLGEGNPLREAEEDDEEELYFASGRVCVLARSVGNGGRESDGMAGGREEVLPKMSALAELALLLEHGSAVTPQVKILMFSPLD
jgi:hypothetical protein